MIKFIGEKKKFRRSDCKGAFYSRQEVSATGYRNCVPIALAILHGIEHYEAINTLLIEKGFRKGDRGGTSTGEFMASEYGDGFINIVTDGNTPAQFAALHPVGKYLVRVHRHVIACIDGTLYDPAVIIRQSGKRIYRVYQLKNESHLLEYVTKNRETADSE